MENSNVLESLGQADFGSAGEIFRNYMRAATRDIVIDVMADEIEMLCGPRYRPDHGQNMFELVRRKVTFTSRLIVSR